MHQLKKEIGILAGMLLMALTLFLHLAPATKKMPLVQEEQQVLTATEETREPASNGEKGTPVSRGDDIDHQSVYILAQVIEGEAADEPYEGKVAVGAVIINRTKKPEFPQTIPGVINEMGAFQSVSNGQSQRPLSSESLNAAVDAMNGKDPSGGALYFWNPSKSTSQWVWSRPVVTQIGRHVFAI